MAADLQRKESHEVARPEETHGGTHFVPRVDIREQDKELTVVADMPGVKPENVEVQYERGELRIHGRVAPRNATVHRYLLREYGVGDFHRAFRIGDGIDPSTISADIKDGVLTLHLPKKEECRPRQIAVKAG